MDSEGYLTLTGRLKKIINRGGEKISPREADEILLDHPAVAQVVHHQTRPRRPNALLLRIGIRAPPQFICASRVLDRASAMMLWALATAVR